LWKNCGTANMKPLNAGFVNTVVVEYRVYTSYKNYTFVYSEIVWQLFDFLSFVFLSFEASGKKVVT